VPETLVQVTLPEMGESVTEGSIVEWRKRVGEFIAEGDPLVDITTDKVDVEVPAPAAGVVTQLFGGEGDTVAVGSVLAEIDTSKTAGEAKTAANGVPSTAPAAAQPATPASAPAAQAAPATPPQPKPPAAEVTASPQARRVAGKLDLDLGSIHGSGPNGLILREDVLSQSDGERRAAVTAAAPAAPAAPPLSAPAGATITSLKGPAAALAGYMEQSLQIPTATSFRTIPVDGLDAKRKELNDALKAAGRSEKLSFTHIIAYAIVRTAQEMPFITYSFRRDERGGATRVEPGIHLGLAVDAERKDGTRFLVVPVVRNADRLDFPHFYATYQDLVLRARDNKLTPDDLQGASFTLTNPGGIGTVASVPRLMAGQGAILATGAIGYPPGFARTPESMLSSLGIGKIMQMTSTYDHRVIQGAQSGEFLRRVDQLLQGADGFYEQLLASLPSFANAQAAASAPATAAQAAAPAPAAATEELLHAVAIGAALVSAYRTHGHLAANLDPLGTEPPGDPKLDPATYDLTPQMMAAVPASVLNVKVPGATLADILPELKKTYASTIAYEVEHISNTEQRRWLRDYIESGKHIVSLSKEHQLRFLRRLTKVEAFERYLRKTFLGQKTFSGEGLDVMVPMLEEILSMLADDGVANAVIGMAHRGRLSVIAHVVNRPYEELLQEFEAAHLRGEVGDDDVTGDVKYHHGITGTYNTFSGKTITVALAHNPSHLEAVDPVVEGQARAMQTDHSGRAPSQDLRKAAPILIHGDSAFTGQGIIAEVFNMQSLPGYTTGGTVHLIANNQIGFTTDERDARSTRYASDLAKGFDVPVIHVNADDVDMCVAAVHLAVEFRRKFNRDVLIDLIGYRRLGHNEQDEPAYTQPQMYDKIKSHPTARELFAKELVEQGTITKEEADKMVADATARLQEAYRNVKEHHEKSILALNGHTKSAPTLSLVAIDKAKLLAWSDEIVKAPEDFAIAKKLLTQFERRKGVIAEKGLVDWGMAESLAFASLLASGIPVRLTGQDTERGTFSHRQGVLHDPNTGAEYIPLQHVSDAKASFEIHNSPLSEYACVGFEYGYSTSAPQALVLWEAQFGDFVNGAQIVIDQYIAAGQAKWSQSSRLTLLLPHGYEGQGPEHSSARLERFLQLVAEGNIRVAYPSTAGNYYHLLRQQASLPASLPLVVMTPKSLLRSEAASGSIDAMASGYFQPVLDDPNVEDKSKIQRILLCSGKIYYDLVASELYAKMKKTAIIRIEMLAPMPSDEINALLDTYSNLTSLVWVQEEPKNMGARGYARRRLLERLKKPLDIGYAGRGYRASPSEGYPGQHAVEQERVIEMALTE
jgi:multifunctional 2-oxoglutarate metabolism enzyme